MLPKIIPYDNTLYKLLDIEDSENIEIFPRDTTERKINILIGKLNECQDNKKARKIKSTVETVWKYISNPTNEIQYRQYGELASNFPIELKNRKKVEKTTRHLKLLFRNIEEYTEHTKQLEHLEHIDQQQPNTEAQTEIATAIDNLITEIQNYTPPTEPEIEQERDVELRSVLNWTDSLSTPRPEFDNHYTISSQTLVPLHENTDSSPRVLTSDIIQFAMETNTTPPATTNQKRSRNKKQPLSKPQEYSTISFGETKIKEIHEHSTRRGKTKAKVTWGDKENTTNWVEMEELTRHPDALSSYLEFLKIKRKRIFDYLHKKHPYLINAAESHRKNKKLDIQKQ